VGEKRGRKGSKTQKEQKFIPILSTPRVKFRRLGSNFCIYKNDQKVRKKKSKKNLEYFFLGSWPGFVKFFLSSGQIFVYIKMIKKSEKKNPKKTLNIFSWALGQGL